MRMRSRRRRACRAPSRRAPDLTDGHEIGAGRGTMTAQEACSIVVLCLCTACGGDRPRAPFSPPVPPARSEHRASRKTPELVRTLLLVARPVFPKPDSLTCPDPELFLAVGAEVRLGSSGTIFVHDIDAPESPPQTIELGGASYPDVIGGRTF